VADYDLRPPLSLDGGWLRRNPYLGKARFWAVASLLTGIFSAIPSIHYGFAARRAAREENVNGGKWGLAAIVSGFAGIAWTVGMVLYLALSGGGSGGGPPGGYGAGSTADLTNSVLNAVQGTGINEVGCSDGYQHKGTVVDCNATFMNNPIILHVTFVDDKGRFRIQRQSLG
jgi:hypothetical protein